MRRTTNSALLPSFMPHNGSQVEDEYALLKGMEPKKPTHQELLAKISKMGDLALAELRRRGVSETEIKGMLARQRLKRRQKPKV
jgi:hypothetical protein